MTEAKTETDSEYLSIEELTTNLYDCYQIQVNDKDESKPVLMGQYKDIPLPINKVIKYKKFLLHLVTYILTHEEIKGNIWKIVGLNIVRQNRNNTICALDLVWNTKDKKYQLIFSDHKKETTKVLNNLDKFPGKDKVFECILEKIFEEPIVKILESKKK